MTRSRAALVVSLAFALASPDAARAGGFGRGSKGGVESKGPASPAESAGDRARRPPPDGVAAPNAVRDSAADELRFGDTLHYQNLSIVPVGTAQKGPFQRYTLLEQGVAAKTLAVREIAGQSGAAQVNAVEVRNSGKDPVYLLGGEMILGGKQDRIIERDTVLAPQGRWTEVPVFCVEAHRWQGQNMEFGAGGALAHIGLRTAALSGDQSKVWEEVARKNAQHGTQSDSGTYRRTIQNAALRRKIAPYRDKLVAMLPTDLEVAGVVFGINGQIQVADLFGNPLLFGALRDKLLTAYILEALGQRVDVSAAPVSKGAAKSFLDDSRKAGKAMMKGSAGRSINYKLESPKMIGSETVDEGTGQKVRETYIKK